MTVQNSDKPAYSGYDCNSWITRDMSEHRKISTQYKNAHTASDREKIKKEYGINYSVLLELPYFDIVGYHVIDRMHNIFLGLAKHTMKTWKEIGNVNSKDYVLMQNRVDSMNPSTKIGRIPRKIISGFAGVTADEWKNWILVFSLYALHGILPNQHYSCWCLLVKACRLLSIPVVSTDPINVAHDSLVKFCQSFQCLYGDKYCTPNIHMAWVV